jgi:hypothetical protein
MHIDLIRENPPQTTGFQPLVDRRVWPWLKGEILLTEAQDGDHNEHGTAQEIGMILREATM